MMFGEDNPLPHTLQMLLPMLLVLAGMATALAVILPLVWRWQTSTHPEPMCRKCGYTVIGLPSQTCPECGSDLQNSGTILPYLARPFPRAINALVWTCLLPGPALLLTSVLYEQLPRPHTRTARFTIVSHEGLPKSVPLEVTAIRRDPVDEFHINVTVRPDNDYVAQKTLRVSLPELIYSSDESDGHKNGGKLDTLVLSNTSGVCPECGTGYAYLRVAEVPGSDSKDGESE